MENNKDQQAEKELALKILKETLAKMEPTLISRPDIIIGLKIFTPQQLLEEVEKDSEEGKLIIDAINTYNREFKGSWSV